MYTGIERRTTLDEMCYLAAYQARVNVPPNVDRLMTYQHIITMDATIAQSHNL